MALLDILPQVQSSSLSWANHLKIMNSRRPRSTPAQQNGNRGQSQVSDRLQEFGWNPKTLIPDSGEDLLVEVLDDYFSSGLAFYIQIKSPLALKRQKGHIIYEIETKDLLHWQGMVPPVFMLIWDVSSRLGYWASVADLIKDLSKRRPEWEEKEKVRVKVPERNGTDDTNLRRLRKSAADIVFPAVAKGRELSGSFAFEFPLTPEGKQDREALERHRATGEAITLSASHLVRAEFSDWLERLYGAEALRFAPTAQFQLGPTYSDEIVTLRLCALSHQKRIVATQNVKVKAVSIGEEQIVYSNEHVSAPFRFSFTAHKSTHYDITFALKGGISTATEAHHALTFFQALSKGGVLRLETTSHQEKWGGWSRLEVPVQKQKSLEPDEEYQKIVKDLAFIEEKAGITFQLDDSGFPHSDRIITRQVLQVLQNGQMRQDLNGVVTTLSKTIAVTDGSPDSMDVRAKVEFIIRTSRNGGEYEVAVDEDRPIELLKAGIPLGPCRIKARGRLTTSCVKRLEQMLEDNVPLHSLDLEWQYGLLTETYFHWLPEEIDQDLALGEGDGSLE